MLLSFGLPLFSALTADPITMDHCKTCKYWAPCSSDTRFTYSEDDEKAGGICQSNKITEYHEKEHGADCLVYSYQEDGYFWTGPDFGCLHHQQVDA